MSLLRFLVDECTNPILLAALRQAAPGIDVLRVGDPGVPPSGTHDADLLLAAERLGRVLITQDKRSMPLHLGNHFAAGHHTAGVMLLRQRFALARYVQEFVHYWATTEDIDWIDRAIFIP